jgi:hypothetical protein
MKLDLLTILLALTTSIQALNKTGQNFNSFYKIEHYYGSRDKEFYTKETLLNDNLSIVKWTNIFDVDDL